MVDEQMAFEYAIYMILGSYFPKTTCSNARLEEKMRLRYCEQKHNTQYQMEEICIRYVEKKILPFFPARVWEQEMRVDLLMHRPEGTIEMRFVCPEYIVRVRGDYKKKNSRVECELWKKTELQKNNKKRKKVVAMQNEMCYSDKTAC